LLNKGQRLLVLRRLPGSQLIILDEMEASVVVFDVGFLDEQSPAS
jgi:hypothetical protein